MDSLRELLQVNSKEALRFFYHGLRETSRGKILGEYEILYVASVLAHYAQTSTVAGKFLPAPSDLELTFDKFVNVERPIHDPKLLENAGCQCLFLVGCFQEQLGRRYNTRWYVKLGQGFFQRASRGTSEHKKKILLWNVGVNLGPLTRACREFKRQTYEDSLLLPPLN